MGFGVDGYTVTGLWVLTMEHGVLVLLFVHAALEGFFCLDMIMDMN